MTKWIKQFLLAGLASREVLIKYKIRHISQLKQWIIQYNSDKLTVAYATRKRVKKMGRKVSFDEKKQIVQWTINHQNNYKEAASKYDISYQRVYSWVRKYLHDHNWEVLKDNRGRNKEKEPTNELERLRKRVRELEAEKRESEVQIAFAKKLVEIRNREVHRPDDIKRFKK
ncbi:helix-turn-helix domain-containing protein [Lactobacillus sp. 0.1XD8-4]|uniref:helix-turn-helix domain-containing protein n=1 Tax=uncultured Limosilactobacillus sp. TaxID=2837629 RepID=UPI00129D4432|nr:helix-turn-helix domain-containing protein [uncultured Limosilactobacillus sp.]MRN06431.1 helix-turn-helix domain-containing protein [Lactobacillus sp. 0.1XD8-4]